MSIMIITCTPPTPITNMSCPIKSDANKLNSAVPANDLKSEKRLKEGKSFLCD